MTDELKATQLATLRQLDPRLKYELKVTAKSAATDEDVPSPAKVISFGPEPGKRPRRNCIAKISTNLPLCFICKKAGLYNLYSPLTVITR